MSVDFPRAWEIARATEFEKHHPKCSYQTERDELRRKYGEAVLAGERLSWELDQARWETERLRLALHDAPGVEE